MILLPYGHEHTSVRRLPWVTLVIMGLCLVAFLLSGRWRPVPSEDQAMLDDVDAAQQWYTEHPYLRLDPAFEETFLTGPQGEAMKEMLHYLGEVRVSNPPLEVLLAEQEHLDTIALRAVRRYQDHTLRKWGLIPADPGILGWVTHMFLHAGWLHLLGNMLILFLAGPFIEDVWGRPIFGGLYLVAGLVAAGFHVLSRPDSVLPMIGASGAIAGVMGAFLIRYGSTKIQFFYLFLPFRGTFCAPAWLMLPIWFTAQVWMGLLTSELDLQAGVAYWAHVGGFAAGIAVAWVMKSQRIEERFVNAGIESKITLEVKDNTDVIEALDLRESDPERAFRMLSLCVMNQPRNQDGVTALLQTALELGRVNEIAPLVLRSIGHQVMSGDADVAVDQWLELYPHVRASDCDPRQLVRLAQALVERDRYEEALTTLQIAMQSGGKTLEPLLAMRIARMARKFGSATARAAAQHVLNHPEADPNARQRARGLLEAIESGQDEEAEAPTTADEPSIPLST